MWGGLWFQQWWMLVVPISPAIHSNLDSLVGMKRFAKGLRNNLNELLGTNVA